MSLILAAALMPPLGVRGRELRGTGLSLLPPHSHPTFSAGSLPYYCRSKNQHRSAISPGGLKPTEKQRPRFPKGVNFKFKFVYAPLIPQWQLRKTYAV